MVFQLQRVVFNMRIFLSIIFVITTSLLSVDQVEAACAADGNGVITVTDNSCSVQPDSYGITMYKMYFCTSAPTAATTSAVADISSCVLVFDAGTTGSRVDMTGTGDAGAFSGATFIRPEPNTYTHGYMLIDNVFYVKYAAKFNEAKEGSKTGTDNGLFCGTLAGTGNESTGQSTTCGSSAIAAEEWGAQLTSFNGSASCLAIVTASNLNNTGADITGVLETSAGVRTSDCSDVDKLGGIQTFASPVVITKNLKTIDVAFGISEGMTIFENGDDPPVINMGSGPFQAVITAIDY